MTPETAKHLDRIEAAIQDAKRLLANHPYQAVLRTFVAASLTDQTIEHHEAVLLLFRSDKNGSAFALSRSIFESLFRGMWFHLCATDAQLQYFEQNDELPFDTSGKRMNMTSMANAIDVTLGYDPNDLTRFTYTDLKNRGWKTLCSYAHSGLLQLARRFRGQSGYSDAEIIETTTTSTTCVLLLVGTFLASQGHDGESDAAAALIGTYGVSATAP